MTEPFTLETSRLRLRPIVASDLPLVFAGLSHPDVIRYYGVHYETIEQTQVQMAWYTSLEQTQTGIWWAVCSADDGTFYGAIGLNGLVAAHHRAELDYWLLPVYWHRGIMGEALPLVCQDGFTRLGLHRIEAVVETPNAASRNVLLRSGFQYEGTMRECEWKQGAYIDLEMYAILNTSDAPNRLTATETSG